MGELFSETLRGLTPLVVALAFLAVFGAAFLRGFTGFGFGLAAVPALSLVMSPVVAVPCTLMLGMLAGVQVLPKIRHLPDWRSVWILVAGSLVGSPIGIWVLTALPVSEIRAVIGVTLVIAVAVLWRQPRFGKQPSVPVGLGTGVVSGLLNGSTGFAGPPVIIYFLSTQDSVPVIRASLMMYFFFSTGGTLVYDAFRGLVGSHVLLLTAIFFPALYIGNWLGDRCFDGSSAATYRRVALGILLILAVLAVGRSLYDEL
jgi:uncharacterized membrane protein YfcA